MRLKFKAEVVICVVQLEAPHESAVRRVCAFVSCWISVVGMGRSAKSSATFIGNGLVGHYIVQRHRWCLLPDKNRESNVP